MATVSQQETDRANSTVWTISRLQADAWSAWNASYGAEEREPFQQVSRDLYNQDVHQRIAELFARSDEQNARLDAMLMGVGAGVARY
jgi:hypothetical protein